MIANSIILPTEMPIDIHDIKRALITYDKVYIPSPDDRELIPPNIYQNALFASLGLPIMPFGMPDSAVKPLGKTGDYDKKFDLVLTECREAFAQGSLEILGAPKYENTVTIGAIPIPDDTPNPYFTYINYRILSENQEFVDLISAGLEKIQINKIKDKEKLLPSCRENEEQSVNDQKRPPKAHLNLVGLDNESVNLLSKMCHSRIGALVKYIGYSHNKQLHPFTTDVGYAKVMSKLEYNFVGALETIKDDKDFLKKQKQIASLQNIILSEFVDPQRLDNLSIKQVLKERTKAWGKTQENRTLLINEISEIAEDCQTEKQFERACKTKFKEFLKVARDYQHQVDKLKLMLLFDANLFLLVKGETFTLLEKILKAPSLETLLILGGIGGITGLQYLRSQTGLILDLIKKAEDKKETTGYAIYTNYKYLIK